MATPTYAKISSLSHWSTFFNHTDGLFRLPSTQGAAIEHLDIDLRYVDDHSLANGTHIQSDQSLHIPQLCVLTLRGGEYVQDDDVRMDALAEVLLAINPVEVRWLNATNDPTEQLSFATHLVHPAVIAAGEHWSATGSLRKLTIQGGFPCPNLSAPTPFSLTPAATPCPSPGPTRTSFGFSDIKHTKGSSFSSGLPALSTTKPKPVDEERLKARAERKRQADYSLKPRFEYAFGSWAVQDLKWRLDGRYTPACIVSIITHFLKAVDRSFPSSTRKYHNNLPALVCFTSLPSSIISELQSLPDKLELDEELREWLADVVFASVGDERHARLWAIGEQATGVERDQTRIKAEMLLLQNNAFSVSLNDLVSAKAAQPGLYVPTAQMTGSDDNSPAGSIASLLPPGTDVSSTEDESDEAITPPAVQSPLVEPVDEGGKKHNVVMDGERSMGSSLVL